MTMSQLVVTLVYSMVYHSMKHTSLCSKPINFHQYVNVNGDVNVKTAITKRQAVNIMNLRSWTIDDGDKVSDSTLIEVD